MRYFIAAVLLLYVQSFALAQRKDCINYDYERGIDYMRNYWLSGDNLELITGDVHFGKYFDVSKRGLRKECAFIPIPTIAIDFQALQKDTAVSFASIINPSYKKYNSFLLKQGKLVTLLWGGVDSYRKINGIASATFLEDQVAAQLYKAYNDPSICLFYESYFSVYGYFKEDKFFYFDRIDGSLKICSKKEYMTYYSNFYLANE